MKQFLPLVFLSFLLIALFIPFDKHPKSLHTKEELIIKECVKRGNLDYVYTLVNSSLPESEPSHKQLVTAIIVVESANRSHIRRDFEYLVAKLLFRSGLQERVLEISLGLGQVKIRYAIQYYSKGEFSSDFDPRYVNVVIERMMKDEENIKIVSSIIEQIEKDLETDITVKQKINQIANKYHCSVCESNIETLYGDVVYTLWLLIGETQPTLMTKSY